MYVDKKKEDKEDKKGRKIICDKIDMRYKEGHAIRYNGISIRYKRQRRTCHEIIRDEHKI